jgi:hypothetical protein
MGMQGSMQVSVDGARGYYGSPVAGTNLTASQQSTLGSDIDAAKQVALAIRQALAQARSSGVRAFRAADDAAFILPAGVSPAERDMIFNQVVGRPWAGSEMSLSDWAAAAKRIDQWVGRSQSMLPPGAGGGVQNVGGQWYVNGEAYSMAELFTATRVNTYNALDEMLSTSLNTIAANNRLVNRLTEVLKVGRAQTSGYARDLIAINGFYQAGHVWDGNFVRPDAVGWDEVKALADAVLGPGSVLATSISRAWNEAGGSIGGDEWKTAMDQLATIIDSKSADNQVAQQRMESVMTLRSNVLEGRGSMLKGQQNMNSNLSRNL